MTPTSHRFTTIPTTPHLFSLFLTPPHNPRINNPTPAQCDCKGCDCPDQAGDDGGDGGVEECRAESSYVVVKMYDDFGDGWNGAYWTWTSSSGDTVQTGTLDGANNGFGGVEGIDYVCDVQGGCHSFEGVCSNDGFDIYMHDLYISNLYVSTAP